MNSALRRLLAVLIIWQCVVARGADEPVKSELNTPVLAKTGPTTEQRFPPLKVPPGFKTTLFACDPLIEYPSAIAAGPRPGAIFVAIDYMTGLGTEITRKSEVRLVEDTDGDGYADKATMFAGGFGSIMGLAWHGGTLYVMHAPFLTALRDTKGTGVADERKDLVVGLGLTPEENPVRLHCANGVTVGHDGWLYLALGDHGCNVQRPEGDRLILEGGGILRCRTDGRDFHVFSSGLRNIYDVALDAELNVFVRDNENDGGDYKIRVCHSFFGADHGYPYLYYEEPAEALQPLADLALGSSAGGACYLGGHFPPEYWGNLFFCEWGKSLVRYPLTRAGSSFAQPKEIEFAVGAQGDPYGFKPTDVVVQRDGTLMVSDYADGQRPKRGRGRIYHIAYSGDSSKEMTSSPADTIARLDSESYFDRCEAQALVEAESGIAFKQLTHALAAGRIGPRGRLHAIWIMVRLQGEKAMEPLFTIAKSDPEPAVRAQAVRAIADLSDPILALHRLDARPGDAEVAERLAALGSRQGPRVALEIVIALGRLRWSGTPDWLNENLVSPDAALAHAAMQAMRQSRNWPAILKLLDGANDSALRAIALRAVSRQYDAGLVDGLLERISREKDVARAREYADCLARVYKKPGPWVYWGYRPAPRPANKAAWERTEAISAALNGMLTRGEPALRLAVLRLMGREKIPASLDALGEWLKDEVDQERVAALLEAMRDQPDADILRQLEPVIRSTAQSITNRSNALALLARRLNNENAGSLLALAQTLEDGPILSEALRLVGKNPHPAAAPLLAGKLDSTRPEVRAAAIETLGELRAPEGRKAISRLLTDRDPQVRRAAAGAAGQLKNPQAIVLLLKMAADDETAVRRATLDALRLLGEPRAVPLAVAALGDRETELIALTALRDLGGPEQAGAVADLAKWNPSHDVLTAAVQALTTWRERSPMHQQHELDRAVAEIQGATGSLVRWTVRDDGTSGDAIDIDTVNPRVQFVSGTEGRVVIAAKGADSGNSYQAQTDIAVPDSTDVELLGSSSGTLQIWLNGQSIYRREKPQVFRIDNDRASATLAKGTNRLAVRVASAPPESLVEFHLRFRRKSDLAEHERLSQAALSRPGNVDRGRTVLLNVEKSLCLKCHRLRDQGERTGPELTGLGNRFSRIYIIESILQPSRTIAPSFGTVDVVLASGKVLSGVKVAESETTFTLADREGQMQLIAKAGIKEQKASPLSTMPEGLERRLSEAEFVDLIAFLANLKESAKP